jgi:hypothetical protein
VTPPEAINVTKREMHGLIGGGFRVFTKFKDPEHAASEVTFRCFPDTVDPRRPKGSR